LSFVLLSPASDSVFVSAITGYAPSVQVTFTTETIPVPTGSLQIEYPYDHPLDRRFNTDVEPDPITTFEDTRQWVTGIYPFVPNTLPVTKHGTVIVPGSASLTGTGYAPEIDINIGSTTKNPPAGAFAFSGIASSIKTETRITPGVGTLTATGVTPIDVTGTFITPASKEIRITPFPAGKEPLLDTGIRLVSGSIGLTGYAVSIIAPDTKITPASGSIGVTGSAPILVVGAKPVWVDEQDPVSAWVDEVPEYAVYGSGEAGFAEAGFAEAGGAGHSQWMDEQEPVSAWSDEN